jgi:hypothetical protein
MHHSADAIKELIPDRITGSTVYDNGNDFSDAGWYL